MTQLEEQNVQQKRKLERQTSGQEQHVEDVSAPLRLPFDRMRPEVPSFRGRTYPFTLPNEISGGLRAVSESEHVAPGILLFAAFQTLLYRYTLRENFFCGLVTPPASRGRVEEGGESAVLPRAVYAELSGELLVQELVQLVHAHARDDQDVFGQQAADGLEIGSAPLTFQVLFSVALDESSATSAQLFESGETESRCDIALEVRAGGDYLQGSIRYNACLFDATTIARMTGHYQMLLASMLQNPALRLCDLPLLTDAEHRRLLVDWNDVERNYPEKKPVHQAFEWWARRTPDALAVTSDDRSLDYRDLNHLSNQLAHALQKRDVALETPVAICMPRSIEFVIGMLGILKAGGTYVPVDPATPSERLAFLLEDTRVPVVITAPDLASTFSEYTGQLLLLSDTIQEGADDPLSAVDERNVAYIIYTSGSTGRPKGVQIEHRGLTNLVQWHRDTFDITSADRASQVAGINFDATGWEIWPYLASGASVHFVDEETRIMPAKLQDWLISHQITIGFLPTPLMESVQNLSWPTDLPLRSLLTGGDKLHRFPSAALPFGVVNNYGPTENSVVTTSCSLTKRETAGEAPSIGTPIANTRVYILDPWMHPVPIGVPGELYVGGDGLARGYLNRPDLTAERFQPDSLGKQPGARLYRTGDLVRYRPDGSIEFLERVDTQVKIRGFRIELGEIETVLGSHPALGDCAVLAREDEYGEKQLVAYLIPAPEQSSLVSLHELRSNLRQRLPHYMIPAEFVWMDQFPLTLNGKVDRRKLPACGQNVLVEKETEPRTPTERSLQAIWQEVMHLERLSVDADFFELGGYSLQATQIVARIRQSLGIALPLEQFFQASTVEDLANYVEHHQGEPDHTLCAIPARSAQEHLPLSFAQERLWFLHQLAPHSAFYNVPLALRLQGPLQLGVLECSLNAIVARHEVLRTTFLAFGGKPVQVIATHLPVAVNELEVDAGSSEGRLAQAMGLMTEQAQLPFDLARGPLLRASVAQVGEQEYVFLVDMHHSVTDGWSVGVFYHELEVCYRAFIAGEQPELPPLMIQYADYACWQRQALQEDALEAQLLYWEQQLQNAPPLLSLPLDHPRADTQTFQGATRSLLLEKSLVQALEMPVGQEKATLFMALLAAFKMLLFSYTGQVDMLVGTPVASRTTVETEQLIGFFVNTLVLRTSLDGDPTYREVLQRVRAVALGAYAHQDLPFDRLVEALHPQRDIAYNPIFQVVFALQDAPDTIPSIEGIEIEPLSMQTETALFDLTIEVLEVDEGFLVSANYNTDLFEETTMQELLQDYEQLLTRAGMHPDLSLSELTDFMRVAPQTSTDQGNIAFPMPITEQRTSMKRDEYCVSSEEIYVAPRSPLEEILVDAWSQVLKRNKIGIQDNFFEVGGHSLLATQLVSRIHDIFQVELPVKTIFQSPTVALVAEELVRYEAFPGQISMIAEVYKEVNAMSDDEAYAVLQQRKNGGR